MGVHTQQLRPLLNPARALISCFSLAACHQPSYQKYIPDRIQRTRCQNTSDHISASERWGRHANNGPKDEKENMHGTKSWLVEGGKYLLSVIYS